MTVERQQANTPTTVSRAITSRLYVSHFLSTWNSRLFEFGSVLFLAAIYPNTLLQISCYALVRSGAAVLLSPAIGSWIDKGDRLVVVRTSIVGQRLAVAASCGLFLVMELKKDHPRGVFALVVVLSCVEKLCSVMNLVSVERDWVVVITDGNEPARRILNARIRRIDLTCKLLGPLLIALVNGGSTRVAIWTTLAMNTASVVVEYICIENVYKLVPGLRQHEQARAAAQVNSAEAGKPFMDRIISTTKEVFPISNIPFYYRHPAFRPSFSLALLYLTVLSLSGQMITFLLSVGYNSFHVGIVRTLSSFFELSTTWISPQLIRRVGPVRVGIWSLSWQMIWLAVGVTWFVADWARDRRDGVVAVSGLVGGVILSRVGLWGYDLAAQNMIQDAVEFNHRGAFSTVEASAQNIFELLSYASTIIFSRPDQFQWPILISTGAVFTAGGLYAAYVRRQRGHLLHTPRCRR